MRFLQFPVLPMMTLATLAETKTGREGGERKIATLPTRRSTSADFRMKVSGRPKLLMDYSSSGTSVTESGRGFYDHMVRITVKAPRAAMRAVFMGAQPLQDKGEAPPMQ